ncbi:MAG: hypothetical protein ACR2HD_04990 [Solirubrobacteraceae bacterium]|nr:MAG: hypothetical protein DLM63_00255 [Solirubrobacterales bacterium]
MRQAPRRAWLAGATAIVTTIACSSANVHAQPLSQLPCADGSLPPQSALTAFAFPLGDGDNALPTCRRMRFGTLDEHDSSNDYGRLLDSPTVSPMGTNANGDVSWPLVDSYGDIIAILSRPRGPDGNLANYWLVSDASGNVIDSTAGAAVNGSTLDPLTGYPYSLPPVQVQGVGCMYPHELERSYALIAFDAKVKGSLTHARISIRAFISQQALPPNFQSGGGPDDANIHTTGCGTNRLTPATRFAVPRTFLAGAYIGRDGVTEMGYGSYDAIRGVAIPIMASTTAVKFGGIFRALAQAGDQFEAYDCFGYLDPNVPGAPQVQWWYGQLIHNAARTGIYGFLPLRPPSATADACPTASPSGATVARHRPGRDHASHPRRRPRHHKLAG